jgi:hypothetical protein
MWGAQVLPCKVLFSAADGAGNKVDDEAQQQDRDSCDGRCWVLVVSVSWPLPEQPDAKVC